MSVDAEWTVMHDVVYVVAVSQWMSDDPVAVSAFMIVWWCTPLGSAGTVYPWYSFIQTLKHYAKHVWLYVYHNL